MYVCKSSSLYSLWLTAVLHLAAVIAVLLITWGISINLVDVQEKARNILGELISTYYSLNPELPPFNQFYVPHLNKAGSISFILGSNDAAQIKPKFHAGKFNYGRTHLSNITRH